MDLSSERLSLDGRNVPGSCLAPCSESYRSASAARCDGTLMRSMKSSISPAEAIFLIAAKLLDPTE